MCTHVQVNAWDAVCQVVDTHRIVLSGCLHLHEDARPEVVTYSFIFVLEPIIKEKCSSFIYLLNFHIEL